MRRKASEPQPQPQQPLHSTTPTSTTVSSQAAAAGTTQATSFGSTSAEVAPSSHHEAAIRIQGKRYFECIDQTIRCMQLIPSSLVNKSLRFT